MSKREDFLDSYFAAREKSVEDRHKMWQIDFKWTKEILEQNGLDKNLKILDVGCADGDFTLLFHEFGILHGVEINEKMREIASKKLSKTFKEIPLDEIYDVIIIRGTLQHIENAKKFYEFLKSCLSKKGAAVFLANPNADSRIYRRFKRLPALDVSPDFASNFTVYSPRALRQALDSTGEFHYFLSYPYFETPYSRPVRDFALVLKSFLTGKYIGRAFPRNMFNLVAVQKKNIS